MASSSSSGGGSADEGSSKSSSSASSREAQEATEKAEGDGAGADPADGKSPEAEAAGAAADGAKDSGAKGETDSSSDADEQRAGELEGEMHRLASSGDYSAAATVRDELSNGTIDDEAQVLCASTEFYEAFRTRDLKRMEALWLEAAYVKCIHPFERSSLGYREVRESWRKLFRDKSLRGASIKVDDVNVHVRGLTAIVGCSEEVVSKGNKEVYSVTNIFRKIGTRWLLIHRHVSPSEPVADYRGGGQVTLHLPQSIINQVQADDDDDSDLDDDSDDDDSDLDDDDDEESMFRFVMDGATEEVSKQPAVAQETVRALRRLSDESLISGQARIRLLSEMLQKPGKSMPERAHKLLLQGVPEKEKKAAWDDFAALMVVEAKKLEVENKRGGGRSGQKA